MSFMQPRHGGTQVECGGHSGGQQCGGKSVVDPDEVDLPKGWTNYLKDPTFHAVLTINPLWLEARRKVLRHARPVWERPPEEEEGDMPTEDQLASLKAAVMSNARDGGYGIQEEDITSIRGLENVKLPLQLPDEKKGAKELVVRRVRLPGRGTGSQWTYTLTGKERMKLTADYSCKVKKLMEPVLVKADPLPPKMVFTKEQRQKRDSEYEEEAKRLQEETKRREAREEQEKQERAEKKARQERLEKAEKERKAKEARTLEEKDRTLEPPSKRARTWRRVESASKPGSFYYVDINTGESVPNTPLDYVALPPAWEKIASTSKPGQFYYYNRETGENRTERPVGVEILNDKVQSSSKPPATQKEEAVAWQRIESKSKPGQFYYFNPKTGLNEEKPPSIDLPWQLCESKTNKGHYYYFHQETGECTEHPPPGAKSAQEVKAKVAATSAPSNRPASADAEKIPQGWEKKPSSTQKGKYYYMSRLNDSSWTLPVWEIAKSSSGKDYYRHTQTGETTWEKPKSF